MRRRAERRWSGSLTRSKDGSPGRVPPSAGSSLRQATNRPVGCHGPSEERGQRCSRVRNCVIRIVVACRVPIVTAIALGSAVPRRFRPIPSGLSRRRPPPPRSRRAAVRPAKRSFGRGPVSGERRVDRQRSRIADARRHRLRELAVCVARLGIAAQPRVSAALPGRVPPRRGRRRPRAVPRGPRSRASPRRPGTRAGGHAGRSAPLSRPVRRSR